MRIPHAYALSIEKPFGFFDAEGKDCVRLKSRGISGRRTDGWDCLFSQCAHWENKRISGALVAGND